MDAIAAAAGVGKGTLFRRFGDKSGLGVALLDQAERVLQRAVLVGPAPLGPGDPGRPATAADRLTAFFSAYLDFVLDNLDLCRMSETASPGARYRIGAYRFWHRHVSILLREYSADCDADGLAHTLLAPVAAEHLVAVVSELGADRIRASVRAVVTSVVGESVEL
jgi:AcrR family transcriptional regulator